MKTKTAYVTLLDGVKIRATIFDDKPMQREIASAKFHRTFYTNNLTIHIIADFGMPGETAIRLRDAIISGKVTTYRFPEYAKLKRKYK